MVIMARNRTGAGHQCLTSVIPATQEAEIRRMPAQSQPQANSVKKKKKKKKNHHKRELEEWLKQ
jgi:hypothetical protein